MNTPPLFSIIIPTLNESKYLPHLLTDLSKQTFTQFETIIIDGQSTDNTIKTAQSFSSLHPHIEISKTAHVSIQRNLGATNAKSPWLVFIDADTRLPDYFFEGVAYRINQQHPDLFTCWITPDSPKKQDKILAQFINLGIETLRLIQQPGGLGAMIGIKKSIFNQIGGFNQNISWGEDYELILKAHKSGYSFHSFPDPKFTFSFRRFRKEGTLNFIRKYAKLELHTFVKGRPQQPTNDYPMLGGKYYDIIKKHHPFFNPTKFNTTLKQLTQTQKARLRHIINYFSETSID